MTKLITNLGVALALVAVTLIAPSAHADTTTTTTTTNPVEQCGDIQVEIKGFGAGLMYQPRPVAIAGEHINRVNTQEKCAVVSWATDIPATSQVIFAEAGETINMDATEENLGFPEATTQNNSAYVAHNAVLHNLTPGKAYNYRVVSRSHPNAVPSVSEVYTLVVPETITLPGPFVVPPLVQQPQPAQVPVVAESTTTHAPPVKYTTKPIVEEKVITITTDLLYGDTEETATVTPTKSDLNAVPAAITAVTDLEDVDSEGSFWTRLKQAFSFFGASSIAKDAVARAGFLIPTLFILLFIFLVQQIALPMLGIIVERPLVFWMFSVIVVAIAGGLLQYYKITLVMIAVFLALLAWYLLSEVGEEVNGSNTEGTAEKLEPKTI